MLGEPETSYNQVVSSMVEAIEQFDLCDSKRYKHWLAQTYFYTSHSVTLLDLFSQAASDESIKRRWSTHSTEEQGHENLALADLKSMGGNIDTYIELPSTRALYFNQIAIAKSTNGVGNLGWAIALEGLAANVSKEYVENILKIHGEKSTSFIQVHIEADPDQIDKALRLANSVNEQQSIIQNLTMTGNQYIAMLNDIKNEVNTM
ncbi:hypothetical protein C9I98_09220 [Photobacterium sanctipauli]|uniref:Iron-containing redox enzyme family protein n=1 Tax=Photobacterium sanctipauli TaxID=1342794 RepID=A0A2T3NVF2_9GAMM|nr:iron-containing redox enzyme family protein [Photobacterium sanctipauli]PSW20225.1 hypothetical protein C9I98_09220 [Photobacterium sanctipauli]